MSDSGTTADWHAHHTRGLFGLAPGVQLLLLLLTLAAAWAGLPDQVSFTGWLRNSLNGMDVLITYMTAPALLLAAITGSLLARRIRLRSARAATSLLLSVILVGATALVINGSSLSEWLLIVLVPVWRKGVLGLGYLNLASVVTVWAPAATLSAYVAWAPRPRPLIASALTMASQVLGAVCFLAIVVIAGSETN